MHKENTVVDAGSKPMALRRFADGAAKVESSRLAHSKLLVLAGSVLVAALIFAVTIVVLPGRTVAEEKRYVDSRLRVPTAEVSSTVMGGLTDDELEPLIDLQLEPLQRVYRSDDAGLTDDEREPLIDLQQE